MRRTVSIDPGHGGQNVGCAHGSIVEKDYTLDFCDELCRRLRYQGIVDPVLIRCGDEDISLTERAQRSKLVATSIGIIVHVNAHVSNELRGLLAFTWCASSAAVAGDTITRVAPDPLGRAREITRFVSHASEPANWLHNAHNILAAYHEAEVPAVLVELGYASNQVDAMALQDKYIRQSLMGTIEAGINHYLWVTEQNSGI